MLVVELKAGCRKLMHQAGIQLTRLGLEYRLVENIGDLQTYEVWGCVELLAHFVSGPWVKRYYLPTTCRVGLQGQGSGGETTRKLSHHAAVAIPVEDRRAKEACAARTQGMD